MEEIECTQCERVIRDEPYTFLIGLCYDCGHVHPLACVHLIVCARDIMLGEHKNKSLMRRAGALGLN